MDHKHTSSTNTVSSSKSYHSEESSVVDETTKQTTKNQQWMNFVTRRVGMLGDMLRSKSIVSSSVTTEENHESNYVIDIVAVTGM